MSTALFSLEGHIALITGSYRGLGKSMAEGLGDAGATVVLNGRNEEALQAEVAAFRSRGLSAHSCAFDITDRESIDSSISVLEREVGKPDILFNNAGIMRRAPLLEMSDSDWRDVIETNLTGAFLVSQRIVPGMIEHGSGKIVNICSLLSEVARETVSSYAAAKSGLKLLTQQMATEWGRYNIQANALGPGYYATEMTQALQDNREFDSWLKARVPAARWGNPAELIGPAIFLASSASDFVNGQTLYVDGGLLARM